MNGERSGMFPSPRKIGTPIGPTAPSSAAASNIFFADSTDCRRFSRSVEMKWGVMPPQIELALTGLSFSAAFRSSMPARSSSAPPFSSTPSKP